MSSSAREALIVPPGALERNQVATDPKAKRSSGGSMTIAGRLSRLRAKFQDLAKTFIYLSYNSTRWLIGDVERPFVRIYIVKSKGLDNILSKSGDVFTVLNICIDHVWHLASSSSSLIRILYQRFKRFKISGWSISNNSH